MNLKIILIASFGSAMLELIYWYELRKRLENRRYRRIVRSRIYWIVVILFSIGSGVATWIWYGMESSEHMSREPREYFLVGAAIPLILKSAVRTFGSSGTATLGSDKASGFSILKDYFQTRSLT